MARLKSCNPRGGGKGGGRLVSGRAGGAGKDSEPGEEGGI